MWTFTPIGFFSATLTNPTYKELPPEQHHDHIMVRARVRGDLVRLVALHQECELGPVPEILALPGHDYPYRIVIPRGDWVELAAQLAERIDYSNFKSAVEAQAETQLEGYARHDLYMRVWSVMNRAEEWLAQRMEQLTRPKQQGLHFWQDPRSDGELKDWGADWPYGAELPEAVDPIFDPFEPGPEPFAPKKRGKKGKKGKKGKAR